MHVGHRAILRGQEVSVAGNARIYENATVVTKQDEGQMKMETCREK
jgi:hypothetical protein